MKVLPTMVLVDTSFLLTMVRSRRSFEEDVRPSILGPIRFSVLDGVVMELQRLARTGMFTAASSAKIALELLEQRKTVVVENYPGIPDVDTAILAAALAEKGPTAVATLDRNLRKILSKHRITAVLTAGRR